MTSDNSAAHALEDAAESLLVIALAIRTRDRHGKNLTARIRDAQVGQLRSPSFEAGAAANPRPDGLPDELKGKTVHSDPTGTGAGRPGRLGCGR